MSGTQNPRSISTKQERIAQLASLTPKMAFKTLSQHMDVEWLREAYQRTRKDGATGVDKETWEQFGRNLEERLVDLLNRAKSGTYRAPPVRRVHIPKADGKTRPLGIPTLEDKVLQRAVVMLLEPIYEQDFHPFSHGFRPLRSAHQALEEFRNGLHGMRGAWVVEVDISKFFDTIDHGHLRKILSQRVQDGVLTRLIGKWLNAGVWEDGSVTRMTSGTPQGGVISPLLANVFLHEVLDEWFVNEVKPRLKGTSFLIRYADDFVIATEMEEDAHRLMKVLPLRFGKFGLTVHPEKTKLIFFKKPPKQGPPGPPTGAFDLLGFTHYWAKSLKGYWVVKRKTAKSRFKRGLTALKDWCRKSMHGPIREQQRTLAQKLRGHFAYYGITGNSTALKRFVFAVRRIWKRALSRRSAKGMTWERFYQLEQAYPLPAAIAVHSTYRRAAKP